MIIHLWAWEFPVTSTDQLAEVEKKTAIDVYQWLREVCSAKLVNTLCILGGPGITVQIDESLFRHKPKVN